MDFQEYLNQEDPQKQPPHSVKVTYKDLNYSGVFLNYVSLEIETVTLKEFGINYMVIGNRGILYTIKKGIPYEPSVFYLVN